MRSKPLWCRSAPLLLGCIASACAIGNSDNRHTLNFLDEHLAPDGPTGRWLLSPVALPVGFVAGVADAVVVRPVTQLDDAWLDTVDVLWQFDHDTTFRAVLLTPLSALATPVIYCGSWLGRSLFDIPDHERDGADEPEPPGQPEHGPEEVGR